MSLLKLFIEAEISVCKFLNEKKNSDISKNKSLMKISKNPKKKIEFKKIWFMQRFNDLRDKYSDVFEELDFSMDLPEIVYRECKEGYKHKDPRCMQFYDFINKIYSEEIMPKQLVYLD